MCNEELLEVYRKRKPILLEVFNDLKGSDFVPCQKTDGTELNESSVDQYMNNLNEKKFFISVCGQIKTGKSTLLNYIIFDGKDVLSTNISVCTAVLTLIRFGESKRVTITFYTEEQWSELGGDTSYFDEHLREFVEQAQQKGVYPEEVVGQPPKEIYDFDDLKEYTSKKGKYTPFVFQVEIEVPNELIKDAIFVDTPGLNDPNKYRSKVTKDWMDKSNASIFLMNSNAVLSSTDMKFIDDYLSYVDKNIFVITRTDGKTDIQRIVKYAEDNLRNSDAAKGRHLLDNKKVYAISTLCALIYDKEDRGEELTKIEKGVKDKPINEEIIRKRGHIGEFIAGVNEHVMKSKGDSIINAAKKQIEGICETKIANVQDSIIQTKQELSDSELGQAELEEKIGVYVQLSDKLRGKQTEYEEVKRKLVNERQREFLNRIDRKKDVLVNKLVGWIADKRTKPADAIAFLEYEFNNIAKKEFLGKNDGLFTTDDERIIIEIIQAYQRELKVASSGVFSFDIGYIFKPIIDFSNLETKIEASAKKLCFDLMEQLKSRTWLFFTDIAETKRKLESEIKKVIMEFDKEIRGTLKSEYNSTIDNNFNKVYSRISQVTTNCIESARVYQKEIDNRQEIVNDLKLKLKNDEELLTYCETKYQEIKRKIL